MECVKFISDIGTNSLVKELEKLLKRKGCGNIFCKSVSSGYMPFVMASLFEKTARSFLFVLSDKEEAAFFFDDLNRLGLSDHTIFFPTAYRRVGEFDRIERDSVIMRTDALRRVCDKSDNVIFVTYPEALSEKVVSKKDLQDKTLSISKGDLLEQDQLVKDLVDFGFEHVDFVYEPGQFSVRGSIIDIFSFSNEDPYRIDLFDIEVESLRIFDIENQRSIAKIDSISIVPEMDSSNSKMVSIFDLLKRNTLIASNNLLYLFDRVESIYQQISEKTDQVDSYLVEPSVFREFVMSSPLLQFGVRSEGVIDSHVDFRVSPPPLFHKNFDLLAEDIIAKQKDGYRTIISSSNEKQFLRIVSIFKDKHIDVDFEQLHVANSQGFVEHDQKICLYTDHQIFERYHRFKLKSKKATKSALTIKDLGKLSPGDYIVHIDHGIGEFVGMIRENTNGKVQEGLRIKFKDDDSIIVGIQSLHRISKYRGKDGAPPKINKLGSPAWKNLKAKAKKKVKDIAKDLIVLYAQRKEKEGFAFSADSYLQNELEASFIYEDTPDQEKATIAIKENMESTMPMDRLICGDVGFGKTEVAIRAAFKAVADNKQVAVLVPTTILAFQHFNTFQNRLKDFPCNIEYISRLRKRADVVRILKDLEEGKIDILIGTHKIVGKDVKFKDLGLMIVDEEQKFGVAVKEKLKKFKVDVDTLTLTATPIPRTLQFSLMGARDLSIINTPPPNRYPVVTEVHGFNAAIIEEAITYEMDRGGQVFFINNRVQNIREVESMITRIVPKARVAVGHGQMDGAELESLLLSFIAGEFDVLVATTIIESGLDIPNANTIIINDAQNFGLGTLHQLRGRVGRTNKKAFCYLLAPPLASLPSDSRKRLQAIEQLSDLGSGFSIAMQDLDIRGAGNILGAEQSGFMADIGFETYHKILSEAVNELKNGEFQGLFDKKESDDAVEAFLGVKYVGDCVIDTDLELRFPEYYVESTAERLMLYRELDNITEPEMLSNFTAMLKDRFGDLPKITISLINLLPIRWKAIALGVERITMKNGIMRLTFVSDQDSPFYESPLFSKLIGWVQQQKSGVVEIPAGEKFIMKFRKISSIEDASVIFEQLAELNV